MPRKPRNINRFTDDRLWDDAGREWSRTDSDLTLVAVVQALSDDKVRVGIHEDFGRPVVWVESSRKHDVWRQQVEPHFADGGIRDVHLRHSDRYPYVASLWASHDDRALIFESD